MEIRCKFGVLARRALNRDFGGWVGGWMLAEIGLNWGHSEQSETHSMAAGSATVRNHAATELKCQSVQDFQSMFNV